MPKKNHYQYKYTFYIKTTYDEFQTSATIVPQGNLTSFHEIKQHISQLKEKEDCMGGGVFHIARDSGPPKGKLYSIHNVENHH
jgi:hypothetical protein